MPDRTERLAERVAVLEEAVRNIAAQHHDHAARLDGPPWERSVRGRLHTLEAEAAAAKAASAALAEAQAERRRARAEREAASSGIWHWRWKLLAAVTAGFVAAAPYVTMFYGR